MVTINCIFKWLFLCKSSKSVDDYSTDSNQFGWNVTYKQEPIIFLFQKEYIEKLAKNC